MEESRREKLLDACVDIDTVMNRFLDNEDMLVCFLKKFKEDSNFGAFREGMAQKQYEDAFKAAHAFKGLCANLSVDRLFDIICSEVEFLRSGMNAEAENLLPKIVEEYERVVGIFETL